MKKMLLVLLFSAFLLSGCGSGENKANTAEAPEVLDVKLTGPEKVNPGESAVYEAAVSYGDEAVTDADEVEFEVWKEGEKEDSHMYKAKQEKGVYQLKTTFKEDGVYTVQSHVTAKKQHSMPTLKVQVGDADAASAQSEDEHSHNH
ncbi:MULTISPECIES: FixH family protein [unclassified Bacillus (in: firmicutes)]|uniref:FixH family protein n=1 Tax=unclassified Bacillus (in: firmicutes) TaxID=185979 RepID=UPI00227FD9C7|nr:FixH family protein [Bacillus sp. S20C3]MCY8203842.1 FixH family protein [Bacillus sp. N12A5]MCY8287115.1 FixH family protein [Bacillus sp. N13C7]MCY8639357.1 FixH family protein [Bacillus sp. S17B2]MCY8718691.1 FixH family protein [Bacillus sp. S10C12M]MCY9143844.1 FixH family protein [Bacillus sp. T9C1]